jgi:hypothetical protein
MGRKKINRSMKGALEAIERALQDTRFKEKFDMLVATLRSHEEKRLRAQEQGDTSAVFPDWNWRNVELDQGRICYSGPYYDLRELCDCFGLPWPESSKIISRMVTGLSMSEISNLPEPPPDEAWRAWRMARTGLGSPRPNEIAQAKELNDQHTSQGRKRDFSQGLTQDVIAHILCADERTVRKWVSDCRDYAQVGTLNQIWSAAKLSNSEFFRLLTKRLEEEKPEE